MNIAVFTRRYPSLLHLTSPAAWEGISKHGLHRATSILTRAGCTTDAQRTAVYRARLLRPLTLDAQDLGTVELRDQKPLVPTGLEVALQGSMAIQDWVDLNNDRVFFWTSRVRARSLKDAAAGREKPACLIELKAAPLLAAYEAQVGLTTFNVGYARRRPKPRNADTFIGFHQYPLAELSNIREVTICADILDINKFVQNVEFY